MKKGGQKLLKRSIACFIVSLCSSGILSANEFVGFGSIDEQIYRAEEHLRNFEQSTNSTRASLQLQQFSYDQIGAVESLYNKSIQKNIVKPLQSIEKQLVEHFRDGFVKDVESDSVMRRCMNKQIGWRDFKRNSEALISRVKRTHTLAQSEGSRPNASRFVASSQSSESQMIQYVEAGDAALEIEECCEAQGKTDGVCQVDYQDSLVATVLDPFQISSVPKTVIDYLSPYKSGLGLTPEEVAYAATHQRFAAALINAKTVQEERRVFMQARNHCVLKTQEYMTQLEKDMNQKDNIFNIVNFLQCADYGTGYWGGKGFRNFKVGFSKAVVPLYGRRSQCTEEEKASLAFTNTITPEVVIQETQLDMLAHPPWLQNVAYSAPVSNPVHFINTPDGGLDIMMLDPQGRQRSYLSLPGKSTAENAFLPNLPPETGGGVVAGGQQVFGRQGPSERQARVDQSSGRRQRSTTARENHLQLVANTRRSRSDRGNNNPRTSRAIASVTTNASSPKTRRAIARVGSIPLKGRALIQGSETNQRIRRVANKIAKGDSPLKNARKLGSHVKNTKKLLGTVVKRGRSLSSATRSKVRKISAYNIRETLRDVQVRKVAALNAQSIADALSSNRRQRATPTSSQIGPVVPTANSSTSPISSGADQSRLDGNVASIQQSNEAAQAQLENLRQENEKKRKKIVQTAKKMKSGLEKVARELNNVIEKKNKLIADRSRKFNIGVMVEELLPEARKNWSSKVLAWRSEADAMDNNIINYNTRELSLRAEIETRMIALNNAVNFAMNDLAGIQQTSSQPFSPQIPPPNNFSNPALPQGVLPPSPRTPQLTPGNPSPSDSSQTAFFRILEDLFLPKAFALTVQEQLSYEVRWSAAWKGYQLEFSRYIAQMQDEEIEQKRKMLELFRKERKRIENHVGFVELDTQTLMEMKMANETIQEEIQDLLESRAQGELPSKMSTEVFTTLRNVRAETLEVEELLADELMSYLKSFPSSFAENEEAWRNLIPAVLLD